MTGSKINLELKKLKGKIIFEDVSNRRGGERKRCTIMFTDVRGFTSLSEKLEPEEVIKILNKALTVQADAVQRNGGMVDKYTWVDIGSSFLPSDILAAILYAQLEQHEKTQAKRKKVWERARKYCR